MRTILALLVSAVAAIGATTNRIDQLPTTNSIGTNVTVLVNDPSKGTSGTHIITAGNLLSSMTSFPGWPSSSGLTAASVTNTASALDLILSNNMVSSWAAADATASNSLRSDYVNKISSASNSLRSDYISRDQSTSNALQSALTGKADVGTVAGTVTGDVSFNTNTGVGRILGPSGYSASVGMFDSTGGNGFWLSTNWHPNAVVTDRKFTNLFNTLHAASGDVTQGNLTTASNSAVLVAGLNSTNLMNATTGAIWSAIGSGVGGGLSTNDVNALLSNGVPTVNVSGSSSSAGAVFFRDASTNSRYFVIQGPPTAEVGTNWWTLPAGASNGYLKSTVTGTGQAVLSYDTPVATSTDTNFNALNVTNGASFLSGLSAQSILPKFPSKRLLILGDSISAVTGTTWADYIKARSNYNGITIVTNAATGGNTASNMVSQWDTNITPWSPRITGLPADIAIFAGVNERNSDTALQIWLSVSNLWDKATNDGFRVCGFTILGGLDNRDTRDKLEWVNSKIRASTNVWRVVDAKKFAGANTQTNIYTADGVHLQADAGYLLALYVESVMMMPRGFFEPGYTFEDRVHNYYGVASNLTILGTSSWAGTLAPADNSASGNPFGTAIGNGAAATNAGVALGWNANGSSSGSAIGYAANGFVQGVSVGNQANSTNSGVAVGTLSSGYNSGVAVGKSSIANDTGVAVGNLSNGTNSGVAVGSQSVGLGSGVAIGLLSAGHNEGVGIGRQANGTNGGTAIGRSATAYGRGSVAIGLNAIVPSGWTNTAQIGPGTSVLQGGLNFRGFPVMDTNGVHTGNGSGLTNIALRSLQTITPGYATNTVIDLSPANCTNYWVIDVTNNLTIRLTNAVAGSWGEVTLLQTNGIATNYLVTWLFDPAVTRYWHGSTNAASSSNKCTTVNFNFPRATVVKIVNSTSL